MNLYDQIAEVCASPHGWCTETKARTLAALVIGTRPKIIVEIGVWSGKSLLPMALACREIGHGVVIGIDPYEASASIEGQEAANVKWWGAQPHQQMHDDFLVDVTRRGLQNVVRLIRDRSDNVTPPDNIGLLHADGNHGPQAMRDIQRFAPHVRDGGFIVLDDLHWSSGDVGASMNTLLAAGFTELFSVVGPEGNSRNDWGVFQKLR